MRNFSIIFLFLRKYVYFSRAKVHPLGASRQILKKTFVALHSCKPFGIFQFCRLFIIIAHVKTA